MRSWPATVKLILDKPVVLPLGTSHGAQYLAGEHVSISSREADILVKQGFAHKADRVTTVDALPQD